MASGITDVLAVECSLAQTRSIAELTCGDFEPIDCEVVIPVNMMMTMSAEKSIEAQVERFRKEQAQMANVETPVSRVTDARKLIVRPATESGHRTRTRTETAGTACRASWE